MKAVSYTRVSTEDQSVNGVSLAAQEQKVKQYAALFDIEIVESLSDPGWSAKNINRPGMKRILEMMQKKEIEAVVVAKLDRLTRSIRDLSEVIDLANKKGIALISVEERIDTATAAGRMLVNMIGVISQWEREAIGERTATSLRYKRASGMKYNGQPLYGYAHVVGRLEPMEDEQGIVERIVGLRTSGETYSGIATKLNEEKIHTRSGGVWFPQQVKRVIQNSGTRNIIESSTAKSLAA